MPHLVNEAYMRSLYKRAHVARQAGLHPAAHRYQEAAQNVEAQLRSQGVISGLDDLIEYAGQVPS